ncbi:MAG: Mur ligase family protein [Pleomorphochaeta sp.]
MKVLIFGLGVNGGGFSAAKYFLEHKNEVLITDIKLEKSFTKAINILEKLGAKFHLGQHSKEDFLWADLVVKNTSILPNNIYLKYAKRITNDFAFLINNYNLNKIKIIGITGTKGKTTTSHAIFHVLKKLNYNVKLVGNMGISAFEIASYIEKNDQKIDYLVCEFSSWQLRDTFLYLEKEFPSTKVAVFTNLLEDHQNSYDSMERYLQDKLKLFTKNTKQVICPKAFEKSVLEKTNIKKRNLIFLETKLNIDLSNTPELIPAYKALSSLKIKSDTILKHLNTFSGVSHRIEWLGIHKNILFVNDSAATIPEAIAFSISHFRDVNLHLICGGTDKNLKVKTLINVFHKVSSITLLDGSFTQNKLIPYLKDNKIKYNGPYKQMKSAVNKAYNLANEDQSREMKVVILSPGATSFELFINEFDRGNQFKKSVKLIIDK